ncbi:hypothetical protein MMC19_006328 [Ptychographa xylographoides]|nr:hypothetical protein [Ptychographa xylographoides]
MTSSTQTQTQTSISIASQPASSIPRGTVTAALSFYSPPADGSAPYNYVEKAPEGQPQNNFGVVDHQVPIHDIRNHEAEFTLDVSSFDAIKNITSQETEFADDAHIKQVYYPEVEKLLLERVPGTKRIFLFDHTIRRASVNASRAPVTRVHIDQTASSAAERVKLHLPDEAETLLKGRFRIINVWRPINGDVESYPLAVADASTVRDDDLVGIEHRYPDRTGETAGVKYNEGQKWWYWSGMGNDERLLLQCYDSFNEKGRVPHTAFVDPRSGESARPRESIEVRALVFG